jgi:hypothetical protein
MSKGISDTLNMKSLEEIMAETECVEPQEEMAEEETLPAVTEQRSESLMSTSQMKGSDHAKAMDEIHDEALDVARQIVDMGMNIDPARAPRILEVANQWFKTAADAKINKRDSELKLMKLIQDQRKLELEERKFKGEHGNEDMIQGEVVYEGDRNKLLKILKAQKDAQKESQKDQPE